MALMFLTRTGGDKFLVNTDRIDYACPRHAEPEVTQVSVNGTSHFVKETPDEINRIAYWAVYNLRQPPEHA